MSCSQCGKEFCRDKVKRCFVCDDRNHLKRDCPRLEIKELDGEDDQQVEDQECAFLEVINRLAGGK